MNHRLLIAVLLAMAPWCSTYRLATAAQPATLVVVTAEGWCPACRAMQPIVERLRKTHRVHVLDWDRDKESRQWGVRLLPTFVAVRSGKETGRLSGLVSEKQITDMLE